LIDLYSLLFWVHVVALKVPYLVLNYAHDLKSGPLGGAKGTILPSLGADPNVCFEKYVDSLLDLLIPGKSAGIKGRIVDLYGQPELLFFGPDGTPTIWRGDLSLIPL
jgi:hypothetical protein